MISGKKWCLEDLLRLSKDRPLLTLELQHSNDFYGHATILKKYAGLPPRYRLKAVIEHGVYLVHPDGWHVERESLLPTILTASSYRHAPLAKLSEKAFFAIGPLIHYAPLLLNETELRAEKARIGQCLLVFPVHSSQQIHAAYDEEAHCRALAELSHDFDTVRVCLYWQDILHGRAQVYLDAGFECVTAGHMYDPEFLPRLKTLITLADCTTSSEVGTVTGYCLALNKPHYIHKLEASYRGISAQFEDEIRRCRKQADRQCEMSILQAFSSFRNDISNQQYAVVNKYWGLDQVKSPAELEHILRTAEGIYAVNSSKPLVNGDRLLHYALENYANGNLQEAEFAISQAMRIDSVNPVYWYTKALICQRRGNHEAALAWLNRFVEVYPDHPPAIKLRDQLHNQIPARARNQGVIVPITHYSDSAPLWASTNTEKILITGGCGYIGAHVVRYLLSIGWPAESIIVFDNLSHGHRELLPPEVPFVQGDLLDLPSIRRIFDLHRITDVLHFAAHAYVGESMQAPGLYFKNNLLGGLHLLESMVKADCRRIIFSSSCAAYGVQSDELITEEAASEPINPYGESKLAFERILAWYHHIHHIGSISLRFFNAGGADFGIGERHEPEPHVIPRLITAAIQNKRAFTIYGNDYDTPDGTCIRDYIHVTDLAVAHAKALKYLKDNNTCQVINLGSGKGISVLQMVHQLENIVGSRIPLSYASRRPGDPPVLTAASNKASRVLGWQPQRAIADILQSAWTWHMQEQRVQYQETVS